MLLGLSWLVARRLRGTISWVWAGWLSQILGVSAALVAMLGLATVLDFPFTWWQALVPAAGLLMVLLVSRWTPGALTTVAFGLLLFQAGDSVFWSRWLDSDEYWTVLMGWLTVCGILAATVLDRFFPPAWLTRGIGMVAWLVGVAMLMGELSVVPPREAFFITAARAAVLAAIALVVVGGWHFVRESRWGWGLAAAVSGAAMGQFWAWALAGGAAMSWLLAAAGFLMVAGSLVAWCEIWRSDHRVTLGPQQSEEQNPSPPVAVG